MIDSVDRAILTEYIEDSRQSFREVARKTNVSPEQWRQGLPSLRRRG